MRPVPYVLMIGLVAVAGMREARGGGVPTGRRSVVVHASVSRHPVLGSHNAPLNILYWPPYRTNVTKRTAPLIRQLVQRFRGQVRVQWMARFRRTRYYLPERHAALVGHEIFAQGGDRLFWRFHDALCGLSSMYRLTNPVVDGAARRVGVDMRRLQIALARARHERAVEADQDLSQRLGVSDTYSQPILLIGTERYYLSAGTRLPHLAVVVQRQLARARALARQGLSAPGIHRKQLELAKKRYRRWRYYRRRRPTHALRFRHRRRRYQIPTGDAPTLGPANAWVTLVAFIDFTDYRSNNIYTALRGAVQRYPKRVRVVYKALPRRSYSRSLIAARAAVAGQRQGRFWKLAEIFFANRWRLYPSRLPGYARQAGLATPRFQRDMRDPKTSQQVLRDMQLARKLGVLKTPALFINGQRFPTAYWNYAVFRQTLRRELKGGLLTQLLGPP